MDKVKLNNAIGFGLIFLILFIWMQLNKPSKDQIAIEKRKQDSIASLQTAKTSSTEAIGKDVANLPNSNTQVDSAAQQKLASTLGSFSVSGTGTNQVISLENNLMKVEFSSKGGVVSKVELKKYFKISQDSSTKKEVKTPLLLLEDSKNIFSYNLPITDAVNKIVKTSDLYFQPQISGKKVVFRAYAGEGKYIEQIYELKDDSYGLQYQVNTAGLGPIWDPSKKSFDLYWENWLDKIEKNSSYERNYSTVYFKSVEDNPDYCSCTKSEKETIQKPVKWISNSNQFFNSSLIAKNSFKSISAETEVLPVGSPDLKRIKSTIQFENPNPNSQSYQMDFYIGPNEFNTLKAYGNSFEDVISFGSSIFGTINRWVMHPIFVLLLKLLGSAGFSILVLTLVVKLVLLPLTYKMMFSQAKMASLKPYIAKIKEKHPDDTQAQQVETMSIYREYGVNPLGGCLPLVIQMPIWLALYRFFPAAIEFRQQPFLWATDLSSYDTIYNFAHTIPMYGDHVSLFSLLWMISTLAYSYYTMKDNEMMGQNAQMMKVMQYAMPVVFVVFFNNFASGLSCYLVFSNLLNITQNLAIKNFFIDHDKIRNMLEVNKSKPKKKSSFQDRLEAAMKEQQKKAAEKNLKNKK